MISTANEVVKLLWEYDLDILSELDSGMEHYPNIDPDWVWLFQRRGEIVASLFAAPVHGVVFLLRLNAKPNNAIAIKTLMEAAFKTMRERGFTMFFTFFDATRKEELKLARVAQRYGCQLLAYSGMIAVGRIK